MVNKRIFNHIIIPLVMPVLFFADAFTPVYVLGCRNRGLIAFIIALASGFAALTAAIIGLKKRFAGDPTHKNWVITVLILTIPVVALLVLK